MRKIIALACCVCLFSFAAFASGSAERNRFTVESYRASIERTVGRALNKSQTVVADATWHWYDRKWDGNWDLKKFDYAVEKGAKNCRNDAIIAAAKAGKFGEKVLKALIVTAGDAAEAFSEWVDRNSARYDSGTKR